MRKTLMFLLIVLLIGSIIAGIILALIIFSSSGSKNKRNDYEGDLIPLKAEVAKVDDYEKAAERIFDNIRNNEGCSNDMHKMLYDDRLVAYQKYSLKLRFLCQYWYDIKVADGDTTIIFRAGSDDYYMRGNLKNWSLYTQFKHSIIYTTKPIKAETYYNKDYEDYGVILPNIDIKLRNRIYYRISSSVND